MPLAHVTISSPNLRSVLQSVKHASIPGAQPVPKPDALTANPNLRSIDSRPLLQASGSERSVSERSGARESSTQARPKVTQSRRSTRSGTNDFHPTSGGTSSSSSSSPDRDSRASSPVPWSNSNSNPNNNKMHQTSSRLLRMTDEDRPFTRVSRGRGSSSFFLNWFFLSDVLDCGILSPSISVEILMFSKLHLCPCGAVAMPISLRQTKS